MLYSTLAKTKPNATIATGNKGNLAAEIK